MGPKLFSTVVSTSGHWSDTSLFKAIRDASGHLVANSPHTRTLSILLRFLPSADMYVYFFPPILYSCRPAFIIKLLKHNAPPTSNCELNLSSGNLTSLKSPNKIHLPSIVCFNSSNSFHSCLLLIWTVGAYTFTTTKSSCSPVIFPLTNMKFWFVTTASFLTHLDSITILIPLTSRLHSP
ncbi:hypothetical protein HanRHA438_Chr17g0792431 [Helianthus annuus]|nr:hypothetical protein HanRHA438_Chr17g0792431 [Helianthus annuus]